MTSDKATDGNAAAVCPVDHKSREAWLAQARSVEQQQQQATSQQAPEACPAHNSQATSAETTPSRPSSAASSWSWRIPFFSNPSSSASSSSTTQQPQHQTPPPKPRTTTGLGTDRVISSIPRSTDPGPSACPANSETETGSDKASGNWIYPSEKMFFDAMKRKGLDSARAADMKTVVPIHNAVNERAWLEIKAWEAPYTGTGEGQCGAPRLHSFTGLSTQMSPKARLNTLLGYTAPFDRHDWVVDRCGTRVEYIIDFYAGRPGAAPAGGSGLSFYLDVRPKLNSWEGVKMRALRGIGLA